MPDTILTPAEHVLIARGEKTLEEVIALRELREAASTALRGVDLRRPEEAIQRDTIKLLYAVEPECIWAHVPNQRASAIQRMILSGLGVKAGFPDLVFLWRGGGGVMEMKAAKGRLSSEQRAFRDECKRLGIPHEVIREPEAAVRALESWGVGMKRRMA